MGKFETVKPFMINIDHFQNNKVMQIKPKTHVMSHDERKNTTITSIKKDFKAKQKFVSADNVIYRVCLLLDNLPFSCAYKNKSLIKLLRRS